MGKGGGSAPPPTPPGDTAKADYGADVASAGFAMEHGTPNQFMPGGSVTYEKYGLPTQELGNGKSVPGGEGVSSVTTAFSPEFQNIFSNLTSAGSNMVDQLPSGAFSPTYDGAAALRQSIADGLPTNFSPNINAEGLRQAYVNEGLRNVQSTWDREDNNFKTLMAERGLPIGSEIWNNQLGEIQGGRSKFIENLTDQAHAAAAADEARQFQQQLTQYQQPWTDYGQAAADQAQQLQQQIVQRQLPWSDFSNFYNSVQGMLAGLQGRDSPLVSASPPNVDVAGITQRYDDQRFRNWQVQQQNSAMGLGGLISAGAGLLGLFSDERLKTDIEKVGETDEEHGGHDLYAYHYVTDPPGTPKRIGFMAQEVEETHPEAVTEYPGTDLKVVNYEKATLGSHLRRKAA